MLGHFISRGRATRPLCCRSACRNWRLRYHRAPFFAGNDRRSAQGRPPAWVGRRHARPERDGGRRHAARRGGAALLQVPRDGDAPSRWHTPPPDAQWATNCVSRPATANIACCMWHHLPINSPCSTVSILEARRTIISLASPRASATMRHPSPSISIGSSTPPLSSIPPNISRLSWTNMHAPPCYLVTVKQHPASARSTAGA